MRALSDLTARDLPDGVPASQPVEVVRVTQEAAADLRRVVRLLAGILAGVCLLAAAAVWLCVLAARVQEAYSASAARGVR